jgi:putative peptidoglycan binding protein/LysM domain-containing protein
MSTDYTVQQGDHLSKIASDYGFSDYRTLWNHAKNADLKSKRKNPNVLYPGDRIHIPDRELREESRSTDKRHQFKMKNPALKLTLVLEDQYEKPLANAKCVLAFGSELRDVTTDGTGRIEEKLTPGVNDAKLIIQDARTAFNSIEIPVKVGHLDPVEEVSGQHARLNNLGYFAGEVDESDDLLFRSAVEEFQCDHGLKVDGVCGTKTQAKLKSVHGC